MHGASKPRVTLHNPSQLHAHESAHQTYTGRRHGRAVSAPALAGLFFTVVSGCGGRTLEEESSTAADALATSTVDLAPEADSTTRDVKGRPDPDVATNPATSDSENTPASTFSGRCAPAPTEGSTTPTSAGSTDAHASTDFTSASITAVTPTTTPPSNTSDEGSTSGNTGPIPAGCGATWCWEDAVAATRTFYSISRDGNYAYGMDGVVLKWPDIDLPRAPLRGWGVVEAKGDDVWVGNASGLFYYDGQTWSQASTLPVLALGQSTGGTTWALFDSEAAPLRRWSDGDWVAEELPAGARGVDLLAVDDTTVWVLTGTAASQRRDGIHTGELTLYEVERGIATVVSNISETQLASPRLVHAADRTLVHDEGGLTQEIYDATTWNLVAHKPNNAIGLYATPDGRLLTNEWPNLSTFADRGNEAIYGQHCTDLVALDQDTMLCAGYLGGLTLLSRSENR